MKIGLIGAGVGPGADPDAIAVMAQTAETVWVSFTLGTGTCRSRRSVRLKVSVFNRRTLCTANPVGFP